MATWAVALVATATLVPAKSSATATPAFAVPMQLVTGTIALPTKTPALRTRLAVLVLFVTVKLYAPRARLVTTQRLA